MSTQEELRIIALAEFASAGYSATSLQRIAELASVSKSSVLYHFASKEHLLEAAIGPAIDRMEAVLAPLEGTGLGNERRAFLEGFVDFLLEYRLEVNMFINQGSSLVDVPVIERANTVVAHLAEFFSRNSQSLEENMRFGIALGGAAYMLCTAHALGLDVTPATEIRAALITIMNELLAPVSTT
ncbi:TetR/AcrR family transcriptional regulator [Salinibacterium sp.]|uniref:TetR/AcrR family transcriptional regulator n=1 Tax=Salinibacterium sp. TaxID=1915057 RepID=UPI00286C1BA7|nr:TetR/AcrR family transcriptional regulator [Salinibacterium sp.]